MSISSLSLSKADNSVPWVDMLAYLLNMCVPFDKK